MIGPLTRAVIINEHGGPEELHLITAEVGDPGLETDARAQRRFFEQQRQHSAWKQRLAQAGGEFVLKILG